MTIHQVTFLYQDSEIAYGEGESVEWAFEEAHEQFKESPYSIMAEGVSVVWVQFDDEDDNHGGKRRELSYWDALTTLC